MTTDDVIKLLVGLLAGVITLVSLAFGVYQYAVGRRRESLAEIIQGEKKTAAAAAVRIRGSEREPRREELEALCIASVFERSGRTRSLIHGALEARSAQQADTIREIVDQITVVIARNASYTDLTRARRRLVSLRAALSLDGDTRTRIDTIERYTDAARQGGKHPCKCEHQAHQWNQLRQPLSVLGSLILVCRNQEKDSTDQSDLVLATPMIALDYHRSALGRFSPTGRTLVDGKYSEDPDHAEIGLEQLASRLQLIIQKVEPYASADAIVAIPGTAHSYSSELGERVRAKSQLARCRPNGE